ncbi:hypothetical protein BU25DRAFT_458147 [Macroventuria anomochaeta]|uniref:Uncharacterized protein n=1 Tax=Macroventuria anomochaeta TaxID=301207 RepID=A0ACB6S2W0_9PLEO|nr:uncharacterized protein BU25DRAFT_458147 [Macroventuria anomochaeta]KAF2628307.1 hypothetical protein BU25DRAFT_458147 [Macroventuria anomochaeta]
MFGEEHCDSTQTPAGNDEHLKISNNPATAVATQIRTIFKVIGFGIIVGIGGGVPSAEADIQLRDVVVGRPRQAFSSVSQYNKRKTTSSGLY